MKILKMIICLIQNKKNLKKSVFLYSKLKKEKKIMNILKFKKFKLYLISFVLMKKNK